MGDHRLERPGQPHELRHVGLSEAVRVQPREGRAPHARRPSEGQGDRVEWRARADGVRRDAPARVRPVGHRGTAVTLFTRQGATCVANFGPGEAAVLRQVLLEVVALLSEGYDRADPVVERLFPDVYPTDPEGSAELDQAGKILAAVEDLPETEGQVRLDEEEAEAWLRALTDVRLALGLRLDIRDDTDLQDELDEAVLKDPTSPRVGQLSVYAYLTYLQESLLAALVGDSPL